MMREKQNNLIKKRVKQEKRETVKITQPDLFYSRIDSFSQSAKILFFLSHPIQSNSFFLNLSQFFG